MQVVLYKLNKTLFDKIINCVLLILSKKLSWSNYTNKTTEERHRTREAVNAGCALQSKHNSI
jgi:hypothetical protein